MLNALAVPDYRTIEEGAVEPTGLDSQSRRRAGNRLSLTTTSRVNASRKINKALTMELTMSALLTHFDSPRQVKSFCVLNANGLPNYFAQVGYPDIRYRPTKTRPTFQVICEVSANREMTDEAYLDDQLAPALAHARAYHASAAVDVTYVLIANLRKIGSDKRLQGVFRNFVTDEENGITLNGPIRFVPIRAPEFGTAVRRLEDEGILRFESHLFARALDVLHERMWNDKIGEEPDWMAKLLVDTVTRGIEPMGICSKGTERARRPPSLHPGRQQVLKRCLGGRFRIAGQEP